MDQEDKLSDYMNAKIALSIVLQKLTKIFESFDMSVKIPQEGVSHQRIIKYQKAVETANIYANALINSLNDIVRHNKEFETNSVQLNKYIKKDDHQYCAEDCKIEEDFVPVEVLINEPEIKEEPRTDFAESGTNINETMQEVTVNKSQDDVDLNDYEPEILHSKQMVEISYPFQCDQCDYKSLSSHKVRRHKASVHDGVRIPCDICNKTFSDQSNLKNHVKGVHLGGYKGKSILKSNVKLSKKKPISNDAVTKVPLYTCDKCSYKTTQSSNLKTHVQSIHEGIRHPCDQCDYRATTKGGLTKHVQSLHLGVRYQCEICDHKASEKSNLKRHMMQMHGDFQYICDQCDYKTKTKPILKLHMKTVHEGVRYQCNQCDYKATQKSSLKTHVMAIHEGFRYLCDKCDFKGTQRGALHSHINRMHPD